MSGRLSNDPEQDVTTAMGGYWFQACIFLIGVVITVIWSSLRKSASRIPKHIRRYLSYLSRTCSREEYPRDKNNDFAERTDAILRDLISSQNKNYFTRDNAASSEGCINKKVKFNDIYQMLALGSPLLLVQAVICEQLLNNGTDLESFREVLMAVIYAARSYPSQSSRHTRVDTKMNFKRCKSVKRTRRSNRVKCSQPTTDVDSDGNVSPTSTDIPFRRGSAVATERETRRDEAHSILMAKLSDQITSLELRKLKNFLDGSHGLSKSELENCKSFFDIAVSLVREDKIQPGRYELLEKGFDAIGCRNLVDVLRANEINTI